jgi:hypothetical protein
MHRRFLFLTLAATFLAFGLGSFEARAASVDITNGVTLDPALVTTTSSSSSVIIAGSNGNTTTVSGDENLTFSAFGYRSIATGTAVAYSPAAVVIQSYIAGNETGFTLFAGLGAQTGGTLDVSLTYTVTAPKGQLLTDASLVMTGSQAGDGYVSIGETLVSGTKTLGTLTAADPGSPTDTLTFAGVQSITVTKDIYLFGGTIAGSNANVSIISQGFSSSTIPEPTSMALLGIGMAGFFTYRRLFKRTAHA